MATIDKKPEILINVAKETDAKTNTVLVTGATGFLGSYLVKALLRKSIPVKALGRDPKIGLELASYGADFRPVDLRDKDSMVSVCENVWAVIHCGALSSAWGKYQDFFDINVTGTKNVIKGCLHKGVKKLIYISSPSVMSVHGAQIGLTEEHPLPKNFVSEYSQTKAYGELEVAKAGKKGLKTVIIRPKAIYGPGDRSVFPRIIEAISKGRLPIFGQGRAMTNLTHVTDVVEAIILALESEKASGKTYIITGDEDVRLYEVIDLIAEKSGYSKPKKKIGIKKAMKVGGILEKVWRTLPLSGEPALTQYKVSIMAYTQTYDISAAKKDLDYKPKVKWRDGIEDFLNRTGEKKGEKPGAKTGNNEFFDIKNQPSMNLSIYGAGKTRAAEKLFGTGNSWKKVDIPALFAHINHPDHGHVLFDTGYSTRFFDATKRFPQRLYGLATPVDIKSEENAAPQLEARGIDPKDVKWIIVSHFDPDHIGGLRDFPKARILCQWRAWNKIAGKTGIKALLDHLLIDLLPDDLTARLLLLPDPAGPAIGPFKNSLDIFQDGSIMIVNLPGHKEGQIGAFVKNEKGGNIFLCADGIWNREALVEKRKNFGVHRIIAKDKPAQDRTYANLRQLQTDMPDLCFVPSHCPLAWSELVEKGTD